MITKRTMASRKRCVDSARQRSVSVVAFGTITCIVSGCALLQKDLVNAGTIQLQEAPSDIARLSRIRVYEDDGDLVVYGKVGRKADVKGRVDATVRVVVRFPDGRTLEVTSRAFPRYLPIRRSRKSNFTVRFHALPPTGTVVRIECPPVTNREATSLSPGASFQKKEIHL